VRGKPSLKQASVKSGSWKATQSNLAFKLRTPTYGLTLAAVAEFPISRE
jgi:hypothetical protein